MTPTQQSAGLVERLVTCGNCGGTGINTAGDDCGCCDGGGWNNVTTPTADEGGENV